MGHTLLSPKEICEAIGKRSKARRLGMGLRQVDLATRAGVPLSTLKRFENAGEASLETATRVAFALNAENEFSTLFPPHDARSLDDIIFAQRSRQRARR